METEEDSIYIVAGDEMQKLMKEKYPKVRTIPFREDLSKGSFEEEYSFDERSVADRSAFWGVSEEEYIKNMSPVMGLDISENYVLCFGDDDCCRANLKFMTAYLKDRGYHGPIKVIIVDEYSLEVLREYCV